MKSNDETHDAKSAAHWADLMAKKIIAEKGEREEYTVASGITPSGTVHLGNFREIITVDLVARALRALGKKVRFIYSWDDYDVFRKVPLNMPNLDELEKHLREPITMVPDTTGECENYARHNEVEIERELPKVGIAPEYLYQAARYRKCQYAEGIKKALQGRAVIKACLNEYRDEKHKMGEEVDYWPVSVFCSKCNHDTTTLTSYDGEYKVSYKCECGNCETVDFRTFGGVKLGWRVDWPMRWREESVVFEPGGKDHISPGGSYDTAKLVSKKIYDWDAPVTMRYDFVNLKGVPGKMSSSKGKVIALPDALNIYQAEVLRYMFAGTRPNTEFAISFDMDVLKVYEDYDKTERIAYKVDKAKSEEIFEKERRIYELSQVDGRVLDKMPRQVTFRQLTTLVQVYSGDIERAINSLGFDGDDKARLLRRAKCAWYWVQNCAPDCASDFCFSIRSDDTKEDFDDATKRAIKRVHREVLPALTSYQTDKDCQEALYKIATEEGLDAKALFVSLYRAIISKAQGPRLGGFLRIIGQERLEKLLGGY